MGILSSAGLLELNKVLDCLLEGTLAIAVVAPRLALFQKG
jgi:hypothetical protein